MFSIWFTSNATAALPQGEILLASGPVSGDSASGGLLPPDTAAWLRAVRR